MRTGKRIPWLPYTQAICWLHKQIGILTLKFFYLSFFLPSFLLSFISSFLPSFLFISFLLSFFFLPFFLSFFLSISLSWNGFCIFKTNCCTAHYIDWTPQKQTPCKETFTSMGWQLQDWILVFSEIDGDNFVGHISQFLIAGLETTGSTIAYALYELALNPEIQNRLRTEIMQVLNKHNGELTYDGIQEMAYLYMVVSGGLFEAGCIITRTFDT